VTLRRERLRSDPHRAAEACSACATFEEVSGLSLGTVMVSSDKSPAPLAMRTPTFHCTDIEGSTAMLRARGETYTAVLTARHG
jgi:hypothetical protein